MNYKELAEQRVKEYWLIDLSITKRQAKKCDLIAINREIELLDEVSDSYQIESKIKHLQKIKEELLKM
jgi:hypothetical protein